MKKLLMIMLICTLALAARAQGYEIKVKINHLKPGDEIILGHHFNERLIPDDTIKLNANGSGLFKGSKKLPGGMYFLFMPNKSYFDIIIDNVQNFSIENDTTDYLKNIVVTGSVENTVFVEYQRFMLNQQEKYTVIAEKQKTAKESNDSKTVNECTAQIDQLNKDLNDHYLSIKKQYPDLFFTKFLTATRDIEVPASITDPDKQYLYYKQHFFDNFEVSDPRLLRTVIYQPKIERYIDKVVVQMPDSLIKECKWLVNQSRSSDELFRFMLIYLFNKYAKSETIASENVYVSLAEIYVKDAVWDTDSFKIQLDKKIAKKKNCLIGNTAKEITMQRLPGDSVRIEALRPYLETLKEKGVELEKQKPDFEARRSDVVKILDNFVNQFDGYIKLSQIKAKYTVLWFMEPDCSHCKKETPEFYKFYLDTLQKYDVAVLCIYMNKSVDKFADLYRHIGKWFDFVESNHFYGWYNIWNPFDQYRENYDISSSPVLYLLDEKKEILAKRIDYHQVYELVDYIDKHPEIK